MMNNFLSWFWNEEFWLPPNITWAIMSDQSQGIHRARLGDLKYALAASILALIFQLFMEQKLLRPLGVALGLKEDKNFKAGILQGLATKFAWDKTTRQNYKASDLEKFCLASYRFVYFSFMTIYSTVILWSKPWFWDTKYCWFRYPHHSIDTDVWIYHILVMAFFLGEMLKQPFLEYYADFWHMTAHHIATVSLISISFATNSLRFSSLVMWVHDPADACLQAMKISALILKYSSNVTGLLYFAFVLTWYFTRLSIYPTWILYSFVEAGQFVEIFPIYHICIKLLFLLLILHFYWFYHFVKSGYLYYVSEFNLETHDLRNHISTETLQNGQKKEQ